MFLKLSLYRNPYKYRNVRFFFEKEALVSCVRTTLTDGAKGGLGTTFLEEEPPFLFQRGALKTFLPGIRHGHFYRARSELESMAQNCYLQRRQKKENVRERRILNNILNRINFWTLAKDISLALKPMEFMLSSHQELYTFSKHKSPQCLRPFMNAHSLQGSPWLCL